MGWIGCEIGLCLVTKNLILEGGLELDKVGEGCVMQRHWTGKSATHLLDCPGRRQSCIWEGVTSPLLVDLKVRCTYRSQAQWSYR